MGEGWGVVRVYTTVQIERMVLGNLVGGGCWELAGEIGSEAYCSEAAVGVW